MSSKPKDGEYTRASDPKNKALPPSVRCMNYAKAFMTAWPAIIVILGLLGYTNKDHIKDWVGLTEADGKTEVVESGTTFEQSVIKNSQEVRAELDEIKAQLANTRALIRKGDSPLGSKIRELEKLHGIN